MRNARSSRLWDRTIYHGYNVALHTDNLKDLGTIVAILSGVQGFAFEGAATALSVLDILGIGRRRLTPLLQSIAPDHVYVIYVGRGIASARLGCRLSSITKARSSSLLLSVDGYGFLLWLLQFSWRHHEDSTEALVRGSYAARAFDQGLAEASGSSPVLNRAGRRCSCIVCTRPASGPLERCRHGCHLYRGMQCGGDGKTRRGSGGTPGVLSARRCICRNCAISRRDCHGCCTTAARVLCGLSVEDASVLADESRVGLAPDDRQTPHMKSGDHVSNPEFHLRVRGRRCLAPSIGWVDTTALASGRRTRCSESERANDQTLL